MERLPAELVLLVLERVPPEDVVRTARRVCRRWRELAARRVLLVRRAHDAARVHAALGALLVTAPLSGPTLRLALAAAPALRHLTITATTPLGSTDLAAIARLPHLDHLDVFLRNRLCDERFASAAVHVSTIVLNETMSPGTLRTLAHAGRLRALHMYGRALFYPRRELRMLLTVRCDHLRELTLRCTELTDRDYEAIGSCSNLTTMRLYSCWMMRGSGALHVVCPRRLRILHITGARMVRSGALLSVIAALPAGLQELALSAGWLGDEHSIALAAHVPGLEVLEVWRCRMTGAGVTALASALPTLQELDTDVLLTVEQLAELSRHLTLRQVRCLPPPGDSIEMTVAGLRVFRAGGGTAALLRGDGEGPRADVYYSWTADLPAPPRHIVTTDCDVGVKHLFEPDSLDTCFE